jgi:hypothetical protein
MVNKGKHHNSALCVVANRMLIPRVLVVMRERRPYELRDFEGNAIDKRQARQLAAQFKVPDDVRQRLRSQRKRTKKKSREDMSPQMTSEHKAPRNETAPRREHSNPNTLMVTTDQLASLVFRSVERLLNSGENLEEIRLQLRHEAMELFQKSA